jgi:hypothetical protein
MQQLHGFSAINNPTLFNRHWAKSNAIPPHISKNPDLLKLITNAILIDNLDSKVNKISVGQSDLVLYFSAPTEKTADSICVRPIKISLFPQQQKLNKTR